MILHLSFDIIGSASGFICMRANYEGCSFYDFALDMTLVL